MRGGSRVGSGRPKGEETKVVAFRLPVKAVPFIKIKIKAYLKTLKKDGFI